MSDLYSTLQSQIIGWSTVVIAVTIALLLLAIGAIVIIDIWHRS
jgi:hypothetical protein